MAKAGNSWRIGERIAPFIPLCIYLGFAFNFFGLFIDDCFITLRYAEHFWQGQGLVWNPGERVEGISNVLWAILLSPLTALGHTYVFAAAKILGILFGGGAVWLTYRLVLKLTNEVAVALILTCGFAGTAYWCAWSASSMETPFYAFLLVSAAYAGTIAIERQSRSFGAICGLLLGLAAFTRPEGAMFMVVAAMSLIIARQWKILRYCLAVAIALLLTGLLLRFSYYRQWVPNTYYAKIGGLSFSEAGKTCIEYVLPFFHDVVGSIGTVLIALSVGIILRDAFLSGKACDCPPRRFAGLFAAGGLMIQLLFVVRSGGDWMPGYRFGVVILPFIAVLGGLLWIEVRERLAILPRWCGMALLVVVAVQVVGTNVAFRTVASPLYYPRSWYKAPSFRTENLVYAFCPTFADVVRQSTRDDELIGTNCAGYVPWSVPRKYIDLCGLNDSVLVRIPGLNRNTSGIILPLREHEPRDSGDRYVLLRNPSAIIVDGMFRDSNVLLGRYRQTYSTQGLLLYRRYAA